MIIDQFKRKKKCNGTLGTVRIVIDNLEMSQMMTLNNP